MGKIGSYPKVNNISDEYKFLIGHSNETQTVNLGTLKSILEKDKLDTYQGSENANKILRVNSNGYIEPL